MVSLGVELKPPQCFLPNGINAQAGVTPESSREIIMRVSDPTLHVKTARRLYVSGLYLFLIYFNIYLWFQEDLRQLDVCSGRRLD